MAFKDLLNSQQAITNSYPPVSKVILPGFVPVNAVAANGVVTFTGTPVANETLTVGIIIFTFKATRVLAGEVAIDANNTTQAANLVTAINADQPLTSATNVAGVVTVTAATKGVAGNNIVLSETATGCAVTGITAGKIDGGVNGTVGAKNEMSYANGFLFCCSAANDISDANWKKVQLNTVV